LRGPRVRRYFAAGGFQQLPLPYLLLSEVPKYSRNERHSSSAKHYTRLSHNCASAQCTPYQSTTALGERACNALASNLEARTMVSTMLSQYCGGAVMPGVDHVHLRLASLSGVFHRAKRGRVAFSWALTWSRKDDIAGRRSTKTLCR